MERDYGRCMVWFLSDMTGGPLPPYLLEIVMRDGRRFYVHSGNSTKKQIPLSLTCGISGQ